MSVFRKYIWVLFISMVPVIELRGAIPVGAGLGLEWYANYILCVVGNMIPVPFILLFIRRILEWMKGVEKIPVISRVAHWVEEKAHKNKGKVLKYATFGLFVFVALPLPGTGAWTGALVAAMLDMRMKYAIPSILGGVLCAGVIMTLASYGVVSFLGFLT